MNKPYNFKKLDEDDILEILIEYFQEGEFSDCSQAQGCLFGKPGEDLRFIGVFSDKEESIQHNLEKLDEELDYNGDHSFIKKNPEFQIHPMKTKDNCQEDT